MSLTIRNAFLILIIGFFLSGCAASTLSYKGADGSSLVLSNYVVNTSDKDGRPVTMIPAESIMKGALDKIIETISSLSSVAGMVK